MAGLYAPPELVRSGTQWAPESPLRSAQGDEGGGGGDGNLLLRQVRRRRRGLLGMREVAPPAAAPRREEACAPRHGSRSGRRTRVPPLSRRTGVTRSPRSDKYEPSRAVRPCQFAGESGRKAVAEGEIARNLSGKANRERGKTLWKVGARPRAEGVSEAGIAGSGESLRLQTEGHGMAAPSGRLRASLEKT